MKTQYLSERKLAIAEDALFQLLLAYAKGELNGGAMNWEDVDIAFETAKEAMPDAYKDIIKELESGE